MTQVPQIFNRNKVKLHRQRAASKIFEHDFLISEVADRMSERLSDIIDAAGKGFDTILNIGSGVGQLSKYLSAEKYIVHHDFSEKMLLKNREKSSQVDIDSSNKNLFSEYVVSDEEKLPFADNSFDLIISNLSMHTINDLPGALVQIRNMLKADGVFIASFYGIETLYEMQKSMMNVEASKYGGVSPRVFPFSDVQTLGSLMQRTGFISPIADNEIIKVAYDDVFELCADIRYMGESNALVKSSRPLNRNLLADTDLYYKENFSDGESGIIASFDIVTITGLC